MNRDKTLMSETGKALNGRWKGSYTIEAAFICPIILFSIIAILYLGMYEHDRIVCQAICEEALYKAQEARREGKDVSGAASSLISQEQQYLFWAENITPSVTYMGNYISVSLTADMAFPFPYLDGIGAQKWTMSGTASTTLMHPAAWIRMKNMLREELNGGADGDDT